MFTRSDRLRPNTTFNRFLGTESDKSLIDDLYLTESCKHESKLVLRSAEGKLLSDDFNHADSNVTHPPTHKHNTHKTTTTTKHSQCNVNNHQINSWSHSKYADFYKPRLEHRHNSMTNTHDVPTRPNQLSIWFFLHFSSSFTPTTFHPMHT